MTLEQLLRWAKKRQLHIEILGDGSCEIEYPVGEDGQWTDSNEDFDYVYLTDGNTLKKALTQAHCLLEKKMT